MRVNHRELKQQARAQLNQQGTYLQMMLANVIPTIIKCVITWQMGTIALNYADAIGQTKTISASQSLAMAAISEISGWRVLQSLALLWFIQGLTASALMLLRGHQRESALTMLLRLFNGQFFFGILGVALLQWIVIDLGFSFFVIPGVVLLFGLRFAFLSYFDGALAGNRSWLLALMQSWRLMQGHKLDYLTLQLSLLGWYLLWWASGHLVDVVVDPYLQMVEANYYKTLQEASAEQIR